MVICRRKWRASLDKFRGKEILRGIDVVFRDDNWGTLPVELAAPEIADDGSQWSYRQAGNVGDLVRFITMVRICGTTLCVEMQAGILAPFRTNRSGLSVLLPLDGMRGRMLDVTEPDGDRHSGRLPELIQPDQPVRNIRKLEWQDCGNAVALDLHADVPFEMEDQRNWTDASFKIYVRPLAMPFPYDLAPGDTVEQSLTLTVEGTLEAGHSVPAAAAGRAKTPGLGLAWLPDDPEPDATAIATLARLAPDGLEAVVDLRRQGSERITAAADIADELGTDLHLRLILADDEDADAALSEIAEAAGPVASAMALPAAYLKSHQPDGDWPAGLQCDAAEAACRRAFPNAEAIVGMLTCFTEFNRHPPEPSADAVTFSTCTTVHAADEASVMETLETLPDVFASAAKLAEGRPVDVGLAAIGFWTNPYGERLAENPDWNVRTLSDRDPRMRGLFAASWIVRYLAHAAAGGIRRVGVGSVSGPLGLLPACEDQDWLTEFPQAQLRPVFHGVAAVSWLGSLRDVEPPLRRGDLAVLRGERGTLVANGVAREVEVPIHVRSARVLDASSLPQALSDPDWIHGPMTPVAQGRLSLPPYAIAILEAEP